MSEEIKMSDYFALPVLHDVYAQDEHAPVYAADCNRVVFKGWNEPALEFACMAINNHDRLTEENKRLSKQLTIITAQRDELLQALESSNDLNARLIGQHNKVNPTLGFL